MEIQDVGHMLAGNIAARLLNDKDLQPRPTAAKLALIRSLAEKVGDGIACIGWGAILGQRCIHCLR